MADTTFTFNGVASTTVPELLVTRVRRPLVAERRDDFVDVPGREGFWLFQERAGSRRITIEGDLQASSFAARRAAVIALADLFDAPDGLVKLVVSDEPDRFHRCRLANAPDPEEWLIGGTVVVELVASPYAEKITPTTETYSAVSNINHTWTPVDKVYGIPEIELTANGGTILTFSVTLNGAVLAYAAGTGLTAGQVVTVSTLGYVVTRGASGDADLDGTFVAANLDMATVSGDFGYLLPAALNSLRVVYTGTATTVGVTVRWRRRTR